MLESARGFLIEAVKVTSCMIRIQSTAGWPCACEVLSIPYPRYGYMPCQRFLSLVCRDGRRLNERHAFMQYSTRRCVHIYVPCDGNRVKVRWYRYMQPVDDFLVPTSRLEPKTVSLLDVCMR